jgi:predicted nucleic acid-binding protein
VSRGWLLDTNVVSELLKGARMDRAVRSWVEHADEDSLYLSVITLGEIAKGIGLAEARGRDMRLQRDFLHRALPERFGERILSFDAEAAIVWGRLLQGLRGNREDERLLAVDAQIAATAEVAALTVCSRNVRDFARLGVTALVDPFGADARP